MDSQTVLNPEALENLRPGIALREDFLPELAAQGITRYRLAKNLRMTQSHLDELLAGKRSVTANIALRLGRLFSQAPAMWLGMQNHYDLAHAESQYGDEIAKIKPLPLPEIIQGEEPVAA